MSDEFDEGDILDLTSENVDNVFGQYEATYILPAVPGKQPVRITVKSASYARVNQYMSAEKSGDDSRILKAACALISESVIGGDGRPIWSTVKVAEMTKGSCHRFMDLQKAVVKHNGLDKNRDIEALIEEESGN